MLLVLGIIALWLPGSQPDLPKPTPLTQIKTDDVHHLQLERPGQPELSFHKNENGWEMDSPYTLSAHHFSLQTLASVVAANSERQLSASPEQLQQYGFDQPLARLVINNHLVIEFGAKEEITRHRYIKINDTVYLILDSWQRLLNAAGEDFISQALLPDHAIIHAIEMPGLSVRKVNDGWRLTPAQEYSMDQVQFLLDNWNYQQANSVQVYTGDGRGERVKIHIQDQQLLEFVIVSRKPFILARADLGIQYVLATGMTRELLQLPSLPSADVMNPEVE